MLFSLSLDLENTIVIAFFVSSNMPEWASCDNWDDGEWGKILELRNAFGSNSCEDV